MAYDTTAINAAYEAAIVASVILDDIGKAYARSVLARLVSAMVSADSMASNSVQAYSIAGRSVTYKTDGSSFGVNQSPNSVTTLKVQLDRMLGRSSRVTLSSMGGVSE